MPVITTNTSANSALRYLNVNSDEQTTYLNRIASGSKITKASDDAAGLAVATKLQADVAVLGQAQTNASHAQSVLETADGGLSQIVDILERMKTLAAQSISGAVTDTERAYLQDENDQLVSEIGSIISATSFNGTALLDGVTQNYLVGTDSAKDVISVTISDIDATTLAVNALKISTTSAGGATAAATSIDAALDLVAAERASVGAQMSRFEYQSSQLDIQEENLDSAQSAIVDADVAEEQSNFSSAQVKTNAAISALAQANQMPQQLLQLLS